MKERKYLGKIYLVNEAILTENLDSGLRTEFKIQSESPWWAFYTLEEAEDFARARMDELVRSGMEQHKDLWSGLPVFTTTGDYYYTYYAHDIDISVFLDESCY